MTSDTTATNTDEQATNTDTINECSDKPANDTTAAKWIFDVPASSSFTNFSDSQMSSTVTTTNIDLSDAPSTGISFSYTNTSSNSSMNNHSDRLSSNGISESTSPRMEQNRNMSIHADLFCCNCRRRNYNHTESVYKIEFNVIGSDIMKRRKFKLFMTSNTTRTEHMICTQCELYLTHDSKDIVERNAWPSFLWKLMTDENVQEIYGAKIWALITTVPIYVQLIL